MDSAIQLTFDNSDLFFFGALSAARTSEGMIAVTNRETKQIFVFDYHAVEHYKQRLYEFGKNLSRPLLDSCSRTIAGDTTGRFYAAHVLRRLAETAVFQTESAQQKR